MVVVATGEDQDNRDGFCCIGAQMDAVDHYCLLLVILTKFNSLRFGVGLTAKASAKVSCRSTNTAYSVRGPALERCGLKWYKMAKRNPHKS